MRSDQRGQRAWGEKDRFILKAASRDADGWSGQSSAKSFTHAMRGQPPLGKIQSANEAKALAFAYVRASLKVAAELERYGKHDQALYRLGLGMHTIADSSLPYMKAFSLGAGRICGVLCPMRTMRRSNGCLAPRLTLNFSGSWLIEKQTPRWNSGDTTLRSRA
jgi:hypothetical protein